jgi:CO dehydrogenase maturation factor
MKQTMPPKPLTISIAGKGGAGKTTLVALLLRTILEDKCFEEILVVDADPSSNIPDILGVKPVISVGSVLDRKKAALEPGTRIAHELLKDKIHENIAHEKGFDYLVMGRTTGTGCYCLVNDNLSHILEGAVKLYDLVLIDFDAGLEHFSRKTDAKSDVLLVVTDPSRMGFEAAKRIKELTEEVGNHYRHQYIIGSKFNHDTEVLFYSNAPKTGLEPLGIVSRDESLEILNMEGRKIFELSTQSKAYQDVNTLFKKLMNSVI